MMDRHIVVIDQYAAGTLPDPVGGHPKGESRGGGVFTAKMFIGRERLAFEYS
jgi:hypothetical protein